MGWGRMLLLGNWGQQMDIEDQKMEIEELRLRIDAGAKAVDSTLKNRMSQLEKENSELRLYLASLIRYLGHKGVLHPDEFSKLVETIDKEDGNANSAYKGRIVK
jgi:cell division septum initiation protein DivIVA